MVYRMKKTKSKQGGARLGAGRPPTIYTETLISKKILILNILYVFGVVMDL
jgi:hypothetical protein